MDVISTIAANGTSIAGAFAIFLALGWIWFRPGSPIGLAADSPPLARAAIYPILGWCLAMIGVNWLRILAIPFRISAPWLLAGLFLVPLICWLVCFLKRRPALRDFFVLPTRGESRRALAILIGLAILALIPVNRLTVPKLDDVGTWGYDQSFYISIADQYFDHGMLEADDARPPGVLRPWVTFNAAIFRSFFDSKIDPIAAISLQSDVKTMQRGMGLIMRNGGAAMDASLAAWLRIDAQQAYVLSSYLQYLFLLIAGCWLALHLRLSAPRCLFVTALAGLWPIGVLPSLLDNRDQALALVLILVLLGSASYGALNVWIRGLVLGALALTYIEILPIAMVGWALVSLDRRPLRAAFKRVGAEAAIAMGLSIVYIPWGVHFMLGQVRNSDTMKMVLPFFGEQLGYLSGLAGSFAGFAKTPSDLLGVFAMLAGAGFLALQLSGWLVWVRGRRFLGAAAFLLLAGIAVVLAGRDYPYAAYKFCTVLFPFGILLTAGLLHGALGTREPSDAGVPFKYATGIAMVCLPGLGLGAALRSGFTFPDLPTPLGVNSTLEDRSAVLLGEGLRVRRSDIGRARSLMENLGSRKRVAFANFIPFDVGYVEHLFRKRSVSLLNGAFFNSDMAGRETLFASNQHFFDGRTKIDTVLALERTVIADTDYSNARNVIVLRGKPLQTHDERTFVWMNIDPNREFAFVQNLQSQLWPDLDRKKNKPEFTFGMKGIVIGTCVVNASAVPRLLKFEVHPLYPSDINKLRKRVATWVCYVNGRKVAASVCEPFEDGFRYTVPLDPAPAGHVVEIGPPDFVPAPPAEALTRGAQIIRRAAWASVANHFKLEDHPQ